LAVAIFIVVAREMVVHTWVAVVPIGGLGLDAIVSAVRNKQSS